MLQLHKRHTERRHGNRHENAERRALMGGAEAADDATSMRRGKAVTKRTVLLTLFVVRSEIRLVGSRDRSFPPVGEVPQPAFGADMFFPRA